MNILAMLQELIKYFQDSMLGINQNDVPEIPESRASMLSPAKIAARLIKSNEKQRRYESLRRAQVAKKYAAHSPGWRPTPKTRVRTSHHYW